MAAAHEAVVACEGITIFSSQLAVVFHLLNFLMLRRQYRTIGAGIKVTVANSFHIILSSLSASTPMHIGAHFRKDQIMMCTRVLLIIHVQ